MKSRCNQQYQYFKKDQTNTFNLLQLLTKVSKNLLHSEMLEQKSLKSS